MPESLNKDDHLKKAHNTVYRLLKLRLRSEQELRNKLKQKQCSESIVEQTIQYFKELDLIDDRLFAQQWTSSRLKKPFGLNRIRMELKHKGIDDDIINTALKRATHDYDELEIVTQLAKHRKEKYRGIESEKVKQRIYGYLLRRGFNTKTIIKVTQNI